MYITYTYVSIPWRHTDTRDLLWMQMTDKVGIECQKQCCKVFYVYT